MAVDFGPVAKPYALLEKTVFGDALQSARTAHLGLLSNIEPGRFLLTGEGDGRFLAQLVKSHPTSQFTIIDSSAHMLERTRRRLKKIPSPHHVELIESDIIKDGLRTDTPPRYDAVFSHFFLDCFTVSEVTTIVKAVTRRLVPAGLWIISDFQKPTSTDGWRRRIYRTVMLGAMYRFFRHTANLHARSFPDYEPIVLRSGFTPVAQRLLLNGFVKSTVFQILP